MTGALMGAEGADDEALIGNHGKNPARWNEKTIWPENFNVHTILE